MNDGVADCQYIDAIVRRNCPEPGRRGVCVRGCVLLVEVAVHRSSLRWCVQDIPAALTVSPAVLGAARMWAIVERGGVLLEVDCAIVEANLRRKPRIDYMVNACGSVNFEQGFIVLTEGPTFS
jgi:hypothetical protein